MWKIRTTPLYKGGGSTTVNNSYQPTAEEIRLQGISADYAEKIMPNALKLNTSAEKMFFDSLGDMQIDYKTLLNQATQQSTAAQQGVAGLTQGELPQAYLDNMQQVINSSVENSLGNAVNNLAQKGVLSSSVSNNAINNISANAANTVAAQYLNNLNTLNGLYGQQATLAGNNMTLAAAGQEAAQAPAINAWNMSLGLGNQSTGALAAAAGKGTNTQTTTTSGGSGLFSGLMGLGAAAISACFTDDTKIKMADGTDKLIRHIKVGDEVLCYNDDGEDSAETVTYVQPVVINTTYALMCADEANNKKVVYTTLTQPILTADGDFVELGMLRIGTKLKSVGKVEAIVLSGERKVYDFMTSGSNKYYANGFIAKGAYEEGV